MVFHEQACIPKLTQSPAILFNNSKQEKFVKNKYTLEEELAQPFKGLENTARNLKPFSA